MEKTRKRMSHKAGLPPGSPIYVGEQKVKSVRAFLINYGKDSFQDKTLHSMDECLVYRESPGITWINVDGLHDVKIIEKLCACFDLHPLTLEDIVNTEQRPKLEVFDEYAYIVVKMHFYNREEEVIETDQLSVVLGKSFILTFQEREGDILEGVRQRLRNNKGRIRRVGADYLAYALLDAVVDHYFSVLEIIDEDIEDLEEELITSPTRDTLESIHGMKRDLIYLKRTIWPIREIISILMRDETHLVHESNLVYLRDLYDHIIQIIDTVETFRDITSGMLDIYLSSVSNRMNEIMKVLTIFAAIFIPLTFIAGIYGMNFNTAVSRLNMPELNWVYGYPFALGLMAAVGIGLLYYFKRKKWF